MKRIIAGSLAAISILQLAACEDITYDIVDKVVEVDEQEYYWFKFDSDDMAKYRISYNHYSGTPMIIYTMDEANFYRFKNGQSFDYYTNMSARVTTGTYATSEFTLSGDGTQYVVAKAENVQDGYWTTATGKIRIQERPFGNAS